MLMLAYKFYNILTFVKNYVYSTYFILSQADKLHDVFFNSNNILYSLPKFLYLRSVMDFIQCSEHKM
jgi:hypothetical protein